MTSPPDERIESLDLLRGLAVLGILVMNIQSFALVEAAYFNPTVGGYSEGLNWIVWLLGRLFADQKFMTIFATLFGAGIILMAAKAERSGRKPAPLHYRRMFFLLVIGLLHAYIFWYGDILVTYALAGMGVYILRKWRPAFLASAGVTLLLVPVALFLALEAFLPAIDPQALVELDKDWNPSSDYIASEIATYRGPWLEQARYRAFASFEMQTVGNLLWGLWRAGGLMLVGMALYKTGFFAARWNRSSYWLIVPLGLATGLALEVVGMRHSYALGWSVDTFFSSFLFNYCASLPMSAAYMTAGVLAVHAGIFPLVRARLAAVGRMAFTNYLAQTLICTTLFYGHGLALFGQLQRWQLLLVVFSIWTLQILWSAAWLRRHPHGPFESLWRRATYGRRASPPPIPSLDSNSPLRTPEPHSQSKPPL